MSSRKVNALKFRVAELLEETPRDLQPSEKDLTQLEDAISDIWTEEDVDRAYALLPAKKKGWFS